MNNKLRKQFFIIFKQYLQQKRFDLFNALCNNISMKNNESFLEKKEQQRKFDAFNVINLMLFVGVLVMFIISLGFCIRNMVMSSNKTDYLVPLTQRILAIIIAFIPLFLKKIFKISFPKLATSVFYLFLFLSIYLGTFIGLYTKTEVWDMIIHFLSGVVFGFFAMFLINLFMYKNKQKTNPYFVFIFVFCFALSIGACWEIYEFTFDSLLGLNMQGFATQGGLNYIGQKALLDTMLDIVFDFFGAVVSAIICGVCAYKYKNFVSKFQITKIKKEQENISQIEE